VEIQDPRPVKRIDKKKPDIKGELLKTPPDF
jgi:hypothetical protein